MKLKYIFLATFFFTTQLTYASILVTGPGTDPNTFSQAVTAKVFDHATGILFLGLANGAGENSVSQVSPLATNNTQPAFTGLGSDFNNEVTHLALSTFIGNQDPNLAVVDTGNEKLVVLTDTNPGNAIASSQLNDANENITAGIVALAASDEFIFASVKKESGTFGEEDGGIAVVEITSATNPLALEERDAQVGGGGNKAQKFDNLAANTPINIGADTVIVADTVAMHWDMCLERLFVGVQIQTGATASDGAQSIGVARVSSTGALTVEAIVPFGAFVNGQVTNIIGARSNGGSALDISAIHVRILHASTGPSYLIVNGGNGTADATNNMVFALPLVDDEDTPSIHGTLAKFDSALVGNVFTTQATANADLLTNASVQAKVGTGPLPIGPTTPIADIVTVGDTVYVSIANTPDANNDVGIFYSQAQFDDTGKVARWTPWTKRAFPFDAISDDNLGRISFFDVDAVTGKLWIVDGQTKQKVHLSDWTTGDGNGSLVTKLNEHLSQGCFCMLDLDQSTHSFDGNTEHRFALFGGLGKVIFARTSEGLANTPVTIRQIVTTDFTLPENFLVTTLPSSAARVRSLEYSRQIADDSNYFFAGTDDGLFVFSNFGGVGVNPDLTDLNDGFFVTGSWSKITTIPGAVFKIRTIGNNLYVLTFETNSTVPLKGKLYLIPFATTVSAMFAASNIKLIAETNTTPTFTTTDWFFDFEIVTNNTDATEEQIILATNTGLYKTTRAGGIQPSTSTQTNASWTLVDATEPALFLGIRGISNAAKGDPTGTVGASPPCTVWPFSIRDDLGFLTCERGEIHQTGTDSSVAPVTCDFVPFEFNSITAATDSVFKTLDRIGHFWTDGARRFFIIKRIFDSPSRNRLYSLPFDVVDWSVESTAQHLILDPPFDDIPFVNWIEQIGATGILMVGTSNGVVALQ